MTDAKEKTTAVVDAAAQKGKDVAVATTGAAGKVVDAAKKAVIPETIVLKASYGNIIFPHVKHAGSFKCATCHGEGTPGLFELNKAIGHDLCKGCHKEKGIGPTDCKGCHKKEV